MKGFNSARRGFTRIELVVVTGTLCVLVTLPLAAVSRNRETSTAAADLNNVRQIMAAMASYTQQNADTLPHPTWGTLPAGPDGWAYITQNNGRLPGLPSTIPNLNGSTNVASQLPWVTKGQLAPYLTSLKVLECPKDVQQRADPVYAEWYLGRANKVTSYNWNGAILGSMFISPRKISEFLGSDVVQWEGNEANPFNFNDAGANPGNTYEAISQRHGHGSPYQGAPTEAGGAGSVGYFDGHAEMMRHREFVRLRDSAQPNPILCGPGYR